MGNVRGAQVLDLILSGKGNHEIAQGLHISKRVAKTHLTRLYRRYGIKGGIKRVKLAVAAYYERNPDLVPFCDGDRASMLGETSAAIFAGSKRAIEGPGRAPSARNSTCARLFQTDGVCEPAAQVDDKSMRLSAHA